MSTPPVIVFHQFDTTKASPSGSRHLHTALAYVKDLGIGASGYLDFGSKNIRNGKQTSKTVAVVAFVERFNDAKEAIFNMKFYLNSLTAWGAGTYVFNGYPSGKWMQNDILDDSDGKFVSTTIPSGQNLWRAANGVFNRTATKFQEITGSGSDSQVTMYQYLSVTVDTNVPVKTYGGDAGGFVYRLTYDYR